MHGGCEHAPRALLHSGNQAMLRNTPHALVCDLKRLHTNPTVRARRRIACITLAWEQGGLVVHAEYRVPACNSQGGPCRRQGQARTGQVGGDRERGQAGGHDGVAGQQHLPPARAVHEQRGRQRAQRVDRAHDDAAQHRRRQARLGKHLRGRGSSGSPSARLTVE